MKHFKQLVKELPAKKVVFTFGRFQPPTTGHSLVVAAVKHVAQKQGADHVIYASRSQDKKSNPLPVDRKVYYLKRMFPSTNFVGANEQVRTFMEAAKELNKKYKNLVMIAGSDRVPEYKKLLEKYNGKEFHYDTIEVISAGERDPDADGASGMSGTKMRDAAKKGDFDSFKRGLPSTLTTVDAKRLMNELREHMGIEAVKEEVNLPKTDLRERYHAGEIFNVDQIVECAGVVYQIKKRGSNHLLLQDQEGNMVSKWITDVTESTQEFTLLQGLNEMKYTSTDKIKVARVIAGALGVEEVEKSSNAEQLINTGLRKVRNKPMRPEYIDVLHNMLQTAKDAGIKYDEKLVPQKVTEGKSTSNKWIVSFDHGPHQSDRVEVSAKDETEAKKTAIATARKMGHHYPMINWVRPLTEGVKQPNGTDKVGGIVNEISKDTLKSYIPKAMGSKSAADFQRGVKMAQGSGGEEELRAKSEKRSAGIHTAIKKLTKEEVSLDEGKMGELHDTISRHLDKHISDFKSGHTGMDQFGSKVLAAHKSVAKEHGLEHKHAAKFVNDYVDSKLNEELDEGWKHAANIGMVAAGIALGSFNVVHNNTAISNLEKAHAVMVQKNPEKAAEIKKHIDAAKFTKGNAKLQATTWRHINAARKLAEETNPIGSKPGYAPPLQNHPNKKYSLSAAMKARDQLAGELLAAKKKREQQNEEVSNILEQIATAAMMNKDTTELKKKLSQLRHDPKNNQSDVESDYQAEPIEKKIGHSITAAHETDTSRKMKIRYQTEEVSLDEDQATAEYKVKTYYDNNQGKTVTRKVRPHKVTFSGSKKNAEPEADSPGEDLKNEAHAGTIIPGTDISSDKKATKVVKEGADGYPAGDMGGIPVGAPDAYEPTVGGKKTLEIEEDEDDIEDSELNSMADTITDLDDIIDAYDDDELHLVDDNGDHVDDLKEETINEVLSRTERMKARIRFAQSKSKRERKIQIALRTPSSVSKLNSRARKLAVKLMKQRIARKPLDKLSVSEKERVEATVAKRKKAIDRLAMKLVSKVKKIEQNRLHRG